MERDLGVVPIIDIALRWLPRALELRANPPETVRLLLSSKATIIPSIPSLCCYHLLI
jgi:hypothetical protein